MRKALIAFLTFVSMSSLLWAPPQNNPAVVAVSSAPSGGCTSNEIRMVRSTGDPYACIGSTWTLLKLKPAEIASDDTANDEDCLTYESSTGNFEWQTCGSGSGGSGTSTIQEGDVTVSSAADTLDFGSGFDLTESPSGEVNVTIDKTEIPINLTSGAGEVTGTLPVSSGGTGATTGGGALSNLGAAASGNNTDITQLTGLTTPLAAVYGGTGQNSIAAAQVFMGNGTNSITKVTIPDCPSGSQLLYNATSGTVGGIAAYSFGCEADGSAGTGTLKDVQEEGATLGTSGSGTTLNFTGTAVTASGTGAVKTIALSQSPTTSTSVVGTERTLTGGAGIAAIGDLSADRTLSVASNEAAFLTSAAISCSGGASDAGKMTYQSSAPLQYCDTATFAKYAAYGNSSGNAQTGDSAASFFVEGELEVLRGGTGVSTLGTDSWVLYNNGGVVGSESAFNYNDATDVLTVGGLTTTGAGDGSRYLELQGNPTTAPSAPTSGYVRWYALGTTGSELPYWRNASGILLVPAAAATDDRVFIANGTSWVSTAMPTSGTTGCSGTNDKILYNSSTNAFTCGTDQNTGAGGSPGGSDTQLQYNDGGVFGGMAGVTWTAASSLFALADGVLFDLSAINNSGTAEGLKLPQGTAPTSGTAEGQVAWDTDDDLLLIGTGAAQKTLVDTSASQTLTSKTLTTPVITGKVDRNNVAVDDDDCTGEQGLYWYDTTDSAFEFCNANSGAPAVLGGGGGNVATDTIFDAKGDLPVGTGSDTAAKLTAGSTFGQSLYTDSAQSTGLAWGNQYNRVDWFNDCFGAGSSASESWGGTGDSGSISWDQTTLVDGSSDTSAGGNNSAVGICQITASTTGNSAWYGMLTSDRTTNQALVGTKMRTFTARVRVGTSETKRAFVGGLRTGTTRDLTTKTDAIGFWCSPTEDVDGDTLVGCSADADDCLWYAVTAAGMTDAATLCDGTPAQATCTKTTINCGGTGASSEANNFVLLQARYDGAGNVNFYINGSSVGAAHTTNIPSTSNLLYSWYGHIENTETTTDSMFIDFMEYHGVR